jgi:hypothetical protein
MREGGREGGREAGCVGAPSVLVCCFSTTRQHWAPPGLMGSFVEGCGEKDTRSLPCSRPGARGGSKKGMNFFVAFIEP